MLKNHRKKMVDQKQIVLRPLDLDSLFQFKEQISPRVPAVWTRRGLNR